MVMKVKLTQAASMLPKYIRAKLVPMIHGSPGMGKSAIVHAIAAQYNLLVIDKRLAQEEPTDLKGYPNIMRRSLDLFAAGRHPLGGRSAADQSWLQASRMPAGSCSSMNSTAPSGRRKQPPTSWCWIAWSASARSIRNAQWFVPATSNPMAPSSRK
jgi:hypothetical protein